MSIAFATPAEAMAWMQSRHQRAKGMTATEAEPEKPAEQTPARDEQPAEQPVEQPVEVAAAEEPEKPAA